MSETKVSEVTPPPSVDCAPLLRHALANSQGHSVEALRDHVVDERIGRIEGASSVECALNPLFRRLTRVHGSKSVMLRWCS